MKTYGVDIGIRSIAIAHLDELGVLYVETVVQDRTDRQTELATIAHYIGRCALDSAMFVEEPPLAGSLNIRTALQLNQTFGSILSAFSGRAYTVPVASWKKAVCGNGKYDKDQVAAWLRDHHPQFWQQCGGDQNLVDATCLALYGQLIVTDAEREGAARGRGLDLPV